MNRLLAVSCFFLILYLGFQFLASEKPSGMIQPEGRKSSPHQSFAENPGEPAMKLFSDYQKTFQDKELFVSFQEAMVPEPVQAVPDTIHFGSGYKVVGIVIDEPPQAIIEDSQRRETLFLLEGDELRGAVLETIEPGKLIFRQGDRLMELTP